MTPKQAFVAQATKACLGRAGVFDHALVYKGGQEGHPSCYGPNRYDLIAMWPRNDAHVEPSTAGPDTRSMIVAVIGSWTTNR